MTDCGRRGFLSFSMNCWCRFTRSCKEVGMPYAVNSTVNSHTESAAALCLHRNLKTIRNVQCCSKKNLPRCRVTQRNVIVWCREALNRPKAAALTCFGKSVLNVTVFCMLPVVSFFPHYCAFPYESSNV